MQTQLILYRTLIAQSRVNSRQVVEVVDVVVDENASMMPDKNCLAVETVCLDGSKETFGYRVAQQFPFRIMLAKPSNHSSFLQYSSPR